MSNSMPEGFEVPLYQALAEPMLISGVPRSFAIINLTVALALGLGLRLWWLGIPLGLAVHTAAVFFTKRDPWWFDVFRRHLRMPRFLDV
jgi:type IV secretion system protein TrbD